MDSGRESVISRTMRICVFCSSSNAIEASYFREARLLGREIARRGHTLIYGGGDIGTMGALARAVKDGGGKVVGVIPAALNALPGVGYQGADEIIVTDTLRERKTIMEENADAFIALPGGLGTLEELLEIITLKQLRYHAKPIVVLNTEGYYDPLFSLLQHAVVGNFIKPETVGLVHVAVSVSDALDYIESYLPEPATLRGCFQTGVALE